MFCGKVRSISADSEAYEQHGSGTAKDDFCAGYCGLSVLTAFQPRIMKLDMGLVRNIGMHADRTAIVRGVIYICRDLGIRVVAEGVETLAEHQSLEDLGIAFVQGFLYARPAFEALSQVVYPLPGDPATAARGRA